MLYLAAVFYSHVNRGIHLCQINERRYSHDIVEAPCDSASENISYSSNQFLIIR